MVNILNIKQYVIIGAFPVHTGINRARIGFRIVSGSVPCTHRDKPVPLNSAPIHLMSVPCTHRDKPTDIRQQLKQVKRSLYAQG